MTDGQQLPHRKGHLDQHESAVDLDCAVSYVLPQDTADIQRRSRWKDAGSRSTFVHSSLDVVDDTTSTGEGISDMSLAKDKGECQLSHQVESRQD